MRNINPCLVDFSHPSFIPFLCIRPIFLLAPSFVNECGVCYGLSPTIYFFVGPLTKFGSLNWARNVPWGPENVSDYIRIQKATYIATKNRRTGNNFYLRRKLHLFNIWHNRPKKRRPLEGWKCDAEHKGRAYLDTCPFRLLVINSYNSFILSVALWPRPL